MFQVQSNVPLPAALKKKRRQTYPFATMQPGDSFAVPGGPVDANRVAAAARYWCGVHGQKFTVGKGPDGVYRCWRTE